MPLTTMARHIPLFTRCLRDSVDESEQYADAHEEVDHGKYLSGYRLHGQVAIANSRERDDAEIKRIEPTPALFKMVEQRTREQDNPDRRKKRLELFITERLPYTPHESVQGEEKGKHTMSDTVSNAA